MAFANPAPKPQVPATGGGLAETTSQVELSISCRDLINRDITSKSDPQVTVFLKDSWQARFFELGKTEVIQDTLDPDFVRKFVLNYNFELIQKIKFEVWDIDPFGGKDFLGQAETSIAEIVAYQGRQFKRPLNGVAGKDCGQIVLVVEEVSTCKQVVLLELKGIRLENVNWLVKNDPFLVISRSNEDGTYTVVHKSEYCRKTLNPAWKPFHLKVTTLCNGDYERTIKVDAYDWRSDGSHKLIGSFFTNLSSLTKRSESKFELVNPKKEKKNKKYKNSGHVELVSIAVQEEISFLDYIRGGTQMHFCVAIDFTASNGDPRDPRSLHYMDPNGRPNPYEIAMRAVGEIIQQYDSQKIFPGFGFGAKIGNQVCHQFPLNGNSSHPYCQNIEELLQFYKGMLRTVTLFGPTNFSPVISNTAAIARQHTDGKSYFVLLIITDGIISDMHQTKRAIVEASRLPLSIIIIGVGSADFSAMDELDSDGVRLAVGGEMADRDIVQFVPISKYLSSSGPWIQSQVDLAKEVLLEIPEQMVSYMKKQGFKPAPAGGPPVPGQGIGHPSAPSTY